MDFDKKYWSDGDYTKSNGEKYYGYVGVYDGDAYIFDTEEALIPNDTFITKVNLSDNFFDRTLSHKLELPYKKEDVVFAANDFLYAGTVKTIIERLQDNNEYIFRNAIIPNSILPYNNSISMFATEDITTYYFYYSTEDPETPVATAPADAYFKNGIIYQPVDGGEDIILGNAVYILNESYPGSFADEILFGVDDELEYSAENINSNLYVNQNREYSRIPRITSTNKIESGILKRYSFSEKGLSAKTQVDPYFYPQREYKSYQTVKSVTGTWDEVLSSRTLMVENKDRKQYNELRILPNIDSKDVYNAINNVLIDADEDWSTITEDLKNADAGVKEEIRESNRFYDNLSGAFKIADININEDLNYTIIIDQADLKSIFASFARTWEGFDEDGKPLEKFNLRVSKFSILVKPLEGGNIVPEINSNYKSSYSEASDGFYYVTYHFIDNGPALTYSDGTWSFDIIFKENFKSAFNVISDVYYLKHAINLKYGTPYELLDNITSDSGTKITSYKKVPMMERSRDYRWIWQADNPVEDGDPIVYIDGLKTTTYKHLTESVDWVNAINPRLKYYEENELRSDESPINYDKLIPFTPYEYMTAEDCHIFTTNNILSYRTFPKIGNREKTKYEYILKGGFRTENYTGEEDLYYIENSFYIQEKYNTQTYKFDINDDGEEVIVSTYKKAEDAYRELNEVIYIDEEKEIVDEYGVNHKSKFDYIPEFKTITTSESKTEPVHDFTQLTNAEMHIIKRSDDGKYLDVLLFLMFKTKLLITKIKHYINEGENFNEDFYLNLREPAGENYIEINCVDPFNKNSLLFKHLTDIKLHKNMLYVCDGELNMVMRYDVEYLISPEEEQAFDIRSIKLLDVLQGNGEIVDKIYFNNPFAIAASDERVYIVDRGNKCVKVYTPSLNYIKILKNGYYATHDIQAIAVNPYPVTLEDGTQLNKDSLWVFSTNSDNLYLSIIDNDSVVSYGQIEDIKLLNDKYSWVEEFKNIEFSSSNSNFYYLATNKRVYKLQTSRPYYPLGSLSYFKQRSLLSSMVWGRMHYKWTKLPKIYSTFQDGNAIDNQVTWAYRPPRSSAEVLDNRCFTLCGLDGIDDQFNGDLIFHLGTLYDENKITQYIKANNHLFDGKMTFDNIPIAELVSMIKSFNMLFYIEPDSFISSLNSNYINVYKTEIEDVSFDDYINAMTFNKMLYSVVYNLLTIKNQIIGTFKAATNLDNVIVYDNMIFDDYFAKLDMGNEANYFVHDNEVVSIVVNRVFEIIYDIQQKLIDNMQTKFMAAQSYVNNTSRII